MVEKKVKKSFSEYEGKTDSGKYKRDCWSDKNKLSPEEVSVGTDKKFWFDCDVCNHEFYSRLANISVHGHWCPYCSNIKRCNKEDCQHCHNNSFASYDGKTSLEKKKVDCWSDKNKLKPRDISFSSGKTFLFDCDVCGHQFDGRLDHITGRGVWCPYCSNKKRCNEEDCQHCHNNSFASYDGKTPLGKKKVDCWSDKNKFTPREISSGTDKKFWFHCDVCGHEFCNKLSKVTLRGQWCPFCSNKKLCDEEDCQDCYNKSFASYEGKTPSGKNKVDCWSSKNENKPRDVFKSSNKKYLFDCDVCGHEFNGLLGNILYGGNWCPFCKNKTELKLLNWFKNCDLIISVKKEYAPDWCSTKYIKYNVKKDCINKGKYQYRFDFLITIRGKKKILIELDGRQHYEQVMNWKSPFCQQVRDKFKEMKAKQNSISVIRIFQEDVWSDKNNWKKKLEDQIKTYMEV